jgi:hypothetical protein
MQAHQRQFDENDENADVSNEQDHVITSFHRIEELENYALYLGQFLSR